MANPNVVSVTFDPNSRTLSVDQGTVILTDPGDTVSWSPPTDSLFPVGANLLIVFEEPLGPFQVIRSVNSYNLLAKGNTAVVESFPYHLYLLFGSQGESAPEPGSPAAQLAVGGPFTIDNQCTTANPLPRVTVTATPVGNGYQLATEPDPLPLHQGDNVLLEVNGLDPGDFLTARFPEGNNDLGLFPTFFTIRQNESNEEDGRRLYVATFGSDQIGLTHYFITIWNELGQFKAFKDPSIDGLGKPPGT